MSMRWSEEDLRSVMNRREDPRNITSERKREIASMGGKARSTKHGNVRTFVDGRWFASKKEADRYCQLAVMKAAGAIRGFTCQVSLPLASGKRRMIIDFMIVENDGRVRFEDAKGWTTDTWATKRDELQYQLGITIDTV